MLKINHLWDFGYVIVDEDGNILHYLDKEKYNQLIELDGEELKLTNFNLATFGGFRQWQESV